jgi:hypothetical protein
MRKMGARTLADLVRMAEALKLPRLGRPVAGLPISVIDGDESTRMALAGLLRLLGFDARVGGRVFVDRFASPLLLHNLRRPHVGPVRIDLKRRLDESGQ